MASSSSGSLLPPSESVTVGGNFPGPWYAARCCSLVKDGEGDVGDLDGGGEGSSKMLTGRVSAFSGAKG